jgi:AraC-like DNA-binding protein
MSNSISVIPGRDWLGDRSFAVWDCYSDNNSTFDGKLHFHEFYELTLVYEGSSVYNVNGRDFVMQPGALQLSTPSDYHISRSGAGEYIRYINVIFNENVIGRQIADALYAFPALYIRLGEAEFAATLAELRSAVEEFLLIETGTPPFGAEAIVRGKIEAVCVRLVRKLSAGVGGSTVKKGGGNDTIRAALLFIRENYRRQITLADAAKAVRLSRGYFCTHFKNVLGVGFSDYLLNYRLGIAAAQIAAGVGAQLKEIAYDSGFRTFSYFSAAFKRAYGVSPREYGGK